MAVKTGNGLKAYFSLTPSDYNKFETLHKIKFNTGYTISCKSANNSIKIYHLLRNNVDRFDIDKMNYLNTWLSKAKTFLLVNKDNLKTLYYDFSTVNVNQSDILCLNEKITEMRKVITFFALTKQYPSNNSGNNLKSQNDNNFKKKISATYNAKYYNQVFERYLGANYIQDILQVLFNIHSYNCDKNINPIIEQDPLLIMQVLNSTILKTLITQKNMLSSMIHMELANQ